ncbi:hypothetical protein DFP72DRAFT_1177622 [Ephemerocybe angulata]|uniref:Uncharacterized protein n=1 Tax=Ephemerocybe angulata TaxID=980116 RepID=A0A8H6HDF7_9AGAR|nr:hypothetical protein DFP72DRAFT_1177622 [Tulosesus angulatus]
MSHLPHSGRLHLPPTTLRRLHFTSRTPNVQLPPTTLRTSTSHLPRSERRHPTYPIPDVHVPPTTLRAPTPHLPHSERRRPTYHTPNVHVPPTTLRTSTTSTCHLPHPGRPCPTYHTPGAYTSHLPHSGRLHFTSRTPNVQLPPTALRTSTSHLPHLGRPSPTSTIPDVLVSPTTLRAPTSHLHRPGRLHPTSIVPVVDSPPTSLRAPTSHLHRPDRPDPTYVVPVAHPYLPIPFPYHPPTAPRPSSLPTSIFCSQLLRSARLLTSHLPRPGRTAIDLPQWDYKSNYHLPDHNKVLSLYLTPATMSAIVAGERPNLLGPAVHKIVDDVLAIIFEACVDPFNREQQTSLFHEVSTLRSIHHVNRRWRSCALAHPSLWGRAVDPDSCSIEWLDLQLKRSNASPLYIVSKAPTFLDTESEIRAKWELLAKHFDRCVYLFALLGPTRIPIGVYNILWRGAELLEECVIKFEVAQLHHQAGATSTRMSAMAKKTAFLGACAQTAAPHNQ